MFGNRSGGAPPLGVDKDRGFSRLDKPPTLSLRPDNPLEKVGTLKQVIFVIKK
jgi:hypothetical protein